MDLLEETLAALDIRKHPTFEDVVNSIPERKEEQNGKSE